MGPDPAMPESETIEIEDEIAEQASVAAAEASAAVNGDSAGPEVEEPPPSELDTVRAELESATQELTSMQDRLLRAQAEFENTRKRLQKEKEEFVQYAAFDTIESLLPVVDDMEQAMRMEQVTPEVKKGLEQIHQKMFAVFQRAGLKEVDQHETFDPRLHEALAKAPATDDQSDQQILEVWRKGYLFKDRLMRASWVKVAVKE